MDRSRRALGDCSVVACLEWSYAVLPAEAVLASISSRVCLKKRLYALRGRLGLLSSPEEALVDDDEDEDTEYDGEEEDIERGGDLVLDLDLLLGVGGECLLTTLRLGLPALAGLSLYLVL